MRTKTKQQFRSNQGFSLVELMIVLIIIALIVAISSVGAIAMRVQTNEGLAKSSLKTVATACANYRVSFGIYPPDLLTMGANFVGGGLEGGVKSGYLFTLKSANAGETFTCVGVPKTVNFTGIKSYCVDTNGAVFTYVNTSSLTADGAACPAGGIVLSM